MSGRSLKQRLSQDTHLVPVLFVILLGVGLTSLVSYRYTKTSVEELVLAQMTQTMSMVNKSLSDKISAIQADVIIWSQEEVFRLALGEGYLGRSAREAANKRLSERVFYNGYSRALVANRQGICVSSSEPALVGVDISDRDYFQRGLTGALDVGTYPVGKVSRVPIQVMSAPMYNPDKEIIGILAVVVETSVFGRDVLDDVHIGTSGAATLFDAQNKLLAKPAWFSAADIAQSERNAIALRNALPKTHILHLGGEQKQQVVSGTLNPLTGWMLMLEVDTREILEPASQLAGKTALVSLGVLVLAGISLHMLRRTINRLRDSEKGYRTLSEALPVGVITFQRTGAVVFANAQAQAYFGPPPASGSAPGWLDMFEDDTGAIIPTEELPIFRCLRDGRAISDWSATLRTPDGTKLVLRLNVAPLFSAESDLSGVVAIFEDITQRKQTEIQLKESEERFRLLVEAAPEAIVVNDALNDKALMANRHAEELFGVSREEILEKGCFRFYLDPQPDGRTVAETVREHRAKVLAGETLIFERTIRNARGLELTCEVRLVKFPFGGRDAIRASWTDITERKRLQEVMIQTEKMMSVGGLAAGMAHEINNPLGIILQTVQNIRRRLDPDFKKNIEVAEPLGLSMPAMDAYLEQRGISLGLKEIASAGERAATIIKNMLSFARQSDSSKSRTNMAVLVGNIMQIAQSDYDLKKKFDVRKVVFKLEVTPETPEVFCSESQIGQVFLNIIKNAVQAMSSITDPGFRPMIEISITYDDKNVSITFADNGPGMDDDVRKRVFEPFYTTKRPGIGTGLGLSVSYFIVTQNHKGRIDVESVVNVGTSFTVVLPRGQA